MISIFLGTTAEAIKTKPVLDNLCLLKLNFKIFWTGQQSNEIDSLIKEGFFIYSVEKLLPAQKNRPLRTVVDVGIWILKAFPALLKVLKKTDKSYVLVHGDTMTSVLAAFAARITSHKIIHLEAGYRSHNWKNPFPEELIRRCVGKIAHFHLTPSEIEYQNLIQEGVNAIQIVNTKHNTAVDNLVKSSSLQKLDNIYGLVTLHRSELIENRSELSKIVELLNEISGQILVKFVLDQRTETAIIRGNLHLDHFIERINKMTFPKFLELLVNADFVITDSGGLQQELAILGIPTLIHRRATETKDGLGENIVLSEWDSEIVRNFVQNRSSYRRDQISLKYSPSEIAAHAIKDWISLE